MTIHRRLLAGLLLALAVLAVAAGGFLYFYMQAVLGRHFDAALDAKARALGSLIKKFPDGRLELEFSEQSAPEYNVKTEAEYFQIWRPDGSLLERSPSLGKQDLPAPGEIGDAAVFWDLALPDGRPGRAVALRIVPVSDEEEHEGDSHVPAGPPPGPQGCTLVVARGRGELDRTAATLLSALLVTGALMAVGTVAVVAASVRRGLRPLGRLAEEAAAINAASLDHRFSVAGLPGELRPIAARLNDLLARLEAAFRRERRFTADVAHELRTPIAELRSLADVAVKWPGDQATAAAYFHDAQQIARQMEALVTTLLALARHEAGTLAAVREPVAVGEVVQEAWQALQCRADERGLTVRVEVPAGLAVDSDRTMLAAIVGNLLGNAVEYTPTGGAVECRAEPRRGGVRLSVTNDAAGLAAEDVPHLFEPFWRKDAARTGGAHSGLGLTLVAAYVAALGGTVEARLDGPGALTVTIDLHGPS